MKGQKSETAWKQGGWKKKRMQGRRLGKAARVWLLLAAGTAAVNVLAWNSTAFCDWHVKYLFPAAVNGYGRFMAVFPFSVGEWMIVAGVLLTLVFLGCMCMGKWICGYVRFYCWLVLIVSIVMTYNCFLLYHASEFDEKYMPEHVGEQYTDTELAIIRDHIVENLNELTVQMEREENGHLRYEGSIPQNAILAMQNLGESYSQLRGYYPQAKPIYHSGFLSQEYMTGYYFPFSMEANYNTQMYIANMPSTICHELSHLKGFLFEDDANFIGFLACIQSEDSFFQYSGYLSVLGYVENEFMRSIDRSYEEYSKHPAILQSVYDDDVFLTDEAWEKVEEEAVLETETVRKAADQFTESVLQINGVEDGMKSYGRVLQLLMQYYDGILY